MALVPVCFGSRPTFKLRDVMKWLLHYRLPSQPDPSRFAVMPIVSTALVTLSVLAIVVAFVSWRQALKRPVGGELVSGATMLWGLFAPDRHFTPAGRRYIWIARTSAATGIILFLTWEAIITK